MSKKQVFRSWEVIKRKAGNPPVQLVTETEYKQKCHFGLGGYIGRANPKNGLICVRYNRPLEDIKETLWHELLHCLFPSKPHWWIECAARRLSGHESYYGWPGRYSRRYAHTPEDLPGKSELLQKVKKASRRLEELSRRK